MKSASEIADGAEAKLNATKIGIGAPLAIASPFIGKIGWDMKEDGNDTGGIVVMIVAVGLATAGGYCLATAGECP